ncbi:MAG: hypothetical protein AAGE92_12260, partial [Cyanobacteria bacterium P01_G01_bin.4]
QLWAETHKQKRNFSAIALGDRKIGSTPTPSRLKSLSPYLQVRRRSGDEGDRAQVSQVLYSCRRAIVILRNSVSNETLCLKVVLKVASDLS